ncbi:hypothetical protein PACID_15890 [Acidipropionibacterium acidipropionici ATCC 4875]|uniref:Uncharacterized protein n=1 Tax=Acidipropionibacterium acidipropionici (strain ATCC 4875 / DSM 20272 / JCM 6432 / NBRC 12425 / NCIMB 8070 / 4) TaxID=1171373 RepID=K7S4A5_ACIA4|nr:hypothetical protein [Acidipropionibacterium acidipropionici]AFV89402.1 hypothetical protein PACID_15890 [Acidipropionibacterium acidipropionici ATCC 4875]
MAAWLNIELALSEAGYATQTIIDGGGEPVVRIDLGGQGDRYALIYEDDGRYRVDVYEESHHSSTGSTNRIDGLLAMLESVGE